MQLSEVYQDILFVNTYLKGKIPMNEERANSLFADMLDLMEFRLIKDENGYGLIDLQGGNLGDIQSERFSSGAEIAERLDRYLYDYYIRGINEGLETIDEDRRYTSNDEYENIHTLLDMRNNPVSKEFLNFIKEYEHDLDTLDMAFNYPEMVVLENLPSELIIENPHTKKENIMSEENTKINDITQGYYRAEEPMYENDEKGVSVQFLLTMDDDTYEKFADKTSLIENSDYENFAELLDSDDYVDAYVQIYEDSTVTAAIGISGSDFYDVPLSADEQEFLRVIVADECNLHCDKSLDDMLKEAKEETKEPNIIDVSNMPDTWTKIIEDNRTDIENNMDKAYRLSMANQLTNISVCMKPDGETYLFEDFARYDRVPESVYNGQDMIVAKFSFNENDMEQFVKACISNMTDEQRNWLKEDMSANNVEANDYQAIADWIDKTCLNEFVEKVCGTLAEQYDASEHLTQILKEAKGEAKEEPLRERLPEPEDEAKTKSKQNKSKNDYER